MNLMAGFTRDAHDAFDLTLLSCTAAMIFVLPHPGCHLRHVKAGSSIASSEDDLDRNCESCWAEDLMHSFGALLTR